MTIGFGNGVFYKINTTSLERFSEEIMSLFHKDRSLNAIEINAIDESLIDYVIDTDSDFSEYQYVSLHAPVRNYKNDTDSNRILHKLEKIHHKHNLQNIVFHADIIDDWDWFNSFNKMPLSVENMDKRKNFGKSIKDMGSILDKYDFKLTLGLQHCFENDPTGKLAEDFQEVFEGRVVEYHLSGYDEKEIHYPLFRTKQDEIISWIKDKGLPIIIESPFDAMGEQSLELKYILERI